MIELVLAACLSASTHCREVSLLYDGQEVSLMACMIGGQAEAARWQASHPDWRITGWRCGLPGDRAREA